MKISLTREELVSSLQLVGRAVSTRTTLPSLAGIHLHADQASSTLRATDMEMSLTREVADVSVDEPGSVAPAGAPLRRRRPQPARRPRHPRLPRRRARRGAHRRRRAVPPQDAPCRGLPEPARGRGRQRRRCPAALLAETIDLVARAASRDEVRPILTGVLFLAEGSDPDDGRDRLLPAERQAHGARGAGPRSRSRRTCPPRRCASSPGSSPRTGAEQVEIALSRNQAVFQRRPGDARLAADRGPVPELAPAHPRLVRARGQAAARRAPRDHPPDQPARAAQRAAAARLRRGRADGRRRDARDRRRDARRCRRRTRGEPLEIAFNPQFLVEGIESVDAEEVVAAG